MQTLIVYDSFFGNTEKISKTIEKEIQTNVKCIKVCDIDMGMLDGIDILIVGSPTRAFAPTKEIVNFLRHIPKHLKVGIFDTRVDVTVVNSKFLNSMVKIFGYATDTMERILKRRKIQIIGIEKFFVKDSEGPLREGELERAREWGMKLLKK